MQFNGSTGYPSESSNSKKFYVEDEDLPELPERNDEILFSNCISSINNDSLGSNGSTSIPSPTLENVTEEEISPSVVKAVTDLARNKRAWPLLADDIELKYLPLTFLQICGMFPPCFTLILSS